MGMTTPRGSQAADRDDGDCGEAVTETGNDRDSTGFRIDEAYEEDEDRDEMGMDCPCCRPR